MVKKIVLMIFAFFIVGCTNSNNIKKESISNDDKITIYFVHRDGCPACIYMDKVLETPEVKSALSKGYRVVVVDINHQDRLPKRSMITGVTPTFYFVDSNGYEVAKPAHTLTVNEFLAKLKEIKED